MPVIHNTIPQFFNGVSQQAPNLRRESQLEAQVNCVSSITEGVLPRPPTEHLAEISSASLGNVFLHTINRDVTERFKVIIDDGEIKVYDFNGVQQTVTYPAGTGYLASSDPQQDFEAYTIKDFTFILNKTIVTAKTSRTAGTLTATLQQFSNLKDEAETDVIGSTYKIEGDPELTDDAYYVEKTVENTGDTGDVYTEIEDPRLTNVGFDASTMPHQLVRTGATTFEFQTISWVDRAAGDDNTNPYPSFTGQTINDIFLHRNRFGFLSGDNVIFSESGAPNFFNFFRTTVTQLLDSDPIDVSANNTRVADLQYAVAFNDDLLLFSEQTQFVLSADELLTPSTVEITPTTEFVTSTTCRPVLAGRNVYFPVERTEYTGIREYFVDVDNRGNDAADITKHVPRYIDKDVYKIIPSANDDILFILNRTSPNICDVYQWYWAQTGQGLNKLQSAWHKWDFGTGTIIKNMDLIDNTVYLVIERDSKTYLEAIDLTTRKFDVDLPYQIRIDRRSSIQGVYDAGTSKTTWTLPFATDDVATVVRDGGFTASAGLEVLNVTRPTTTTIEAFGNFSESKCVVGFEYNKRLQLSPFYVRRQSGNGATVSRLGGRLQLRKLKLFYSDSSFFTVNVTPKSRGTNSKTFTAPIGSDEAKIGQITPRDGIFSVVIGSKADTTTIEITSDSYLPFGITSAEWEGFYHSNAR